MFYEVICYSIISLVNLVKYASNHFQSPIIVTSKVVTVYVFVYGTLKKDEPNHHWLTEEQNGTALFYGNGKTVQKYPLVISSRYNIPFLLDSPGNGKNIFGEVYEIDEKKLSHLDILEECPKLYIRRLEKILCDDQKTIEAWCYFLPDFRPEMLELEQLESYSGNGPHNKPYIASEDDLTDRNDIYDALYQCKE